MKSKIIPLVAACLWLNIPMLFCQYVGWTNEIKSIRYEQLQGLRVTQNGETFITGSIEGATSTFFGNIIVPYTDLSNNYFVARCDQNGNFKWVRTGGGWSSNLGYSVDFDENGNIYTTGSCMGNARFDSIYLPQNQNPGIMFLLKYNATGNIQWAKRFDPTSNNNGGGACLRYKNGYVYDFVANIGSEVQLFDTSLVYDRSKIGSVIYLARFDTMGNFMGASKIAGNTISMAIREAIPVDHDFIITGYSQFYNIYIDTITIPVPFPKFQSFVARYDSNFNVVWARKFSSTNFESFVLGLDVDDDKNIIATGVYYDTLMVDGHTLINNSSADPKSFVCKLDPSGHLIWIKDINGLGYLANIGITHYKDKIYTTGHFHGYLLVDDVYLESPGQMNLTILEFDTNGNAIHGEVLGSQDNYIQANNIGIDTNGSLYITGQYLDYARLQNHSMYADHLDDWANTTDGFIFKYGSTLINAVPNSPINKNEIKLYPNPNKGKFMLSSSGMESHKTMEVINIFGEIVFSKVINSTNEIIELKNIPAGTYILRMHDEKNQSAIRFIIQN